MVRDALGRHASVARAAGELGVTPPGLSKLMVRLHVDRFDPSRVRAGPARPANARNCNADTLAGGKQFTGSDPARWL